MSRNRFRNRPKRISRRDERERFDVFMPLAWIISMVGTAVVTGALLHYGVSNQLPSRELGAGVILSMVPASVGLIRFVRGHYSNALDEP